MVSWLREDQPEWEQFSLGVPLGGWPLPGWNELVEWFRRRRVAVQAGPRAVLVIGVRESCEWVFQCGMNWKAGMQRSFLDGSQRVPFLVPIQVDQTSSIECQSVIPVFAFNNTRRGRLAG